MGANGKAAAIHRFMCDHPGFGYSWAERYGGPETVEVEGATINVGDYDCSSSTITAWRKAVEGTPYAGSLDGATYTGNMRSVFVGSGLFEWVPVEQAQIGDLYLNEQCHVAMCQGDGTLSEFSGNEFGGAYGGQRGDQTGWESHVCGWYSYPWDGCLHYNGKADERRPFQEPGEAVNDAGLWYRAHVQDVGWLDAVHDGQVAGTVTFAKAMEAFKVAPPEGWVLDVAVHVAKKGWLRFKGIRRGKSSGEGSSKTDPVIGTVGENLAIEDVSVKVTKRPEGDKRRLWFRVHQAGKGWKAWTKEGYASGSDGLGIPLEAIQMKVE